MLRIKKIDHGLATLRQRILTPSGATVPLKARSAPENARDAILAETREDWTEVTADFVWGGPDTYCWFAGAFTLPEAVDGLGIYLAIEADFRNTMGRSVPQMLARLDGAIVGGVDGNHREIRIAEKAQSGQHHEVLIEAGPVEFGRQLGITCRLMSHDPLAEAVYYDLRVPMDVARLLPEDDPRRNFIINRVDAGLAAIDFRPGNADRFARSLEAARAIAAETYQAHDFAGTPTISVTGHTHIDVAWLWPIRETRQKMARSMATALTLMDEFTDYRFMYNQGVLLAYLQEDYPELFAKLSEKVKAGQFEIEGALWLEPDANITGGESFVRHVMHGVHYHEDTFGVRPRIMWLPDTFGYSAALPQIMRRSGLDVFITHKMSWNDTNRMPNETFYWQGIDGTRVPSYFLTAQPYDSSSINTTYNPDLKPTHVMGAWRRHGQKSLNDELFLVYGHGDGGGGPTREMLENIRRMEKGIPGCPKVRHEHMRPFFERLLQRMDEAPETFPTWVGELYLEFHRGTLTSVAKNKRNNSMAETALRELEALATLAMVQAGHAYPADRLHALWRIVLLNQFHDILPGSSIGPVYADSDADYARFFEGADALRRELVGVLAGETTVVFNALGRPRSGLLTLPGEGPKSVTVSGRTRQTQSIARADGSSAQAVPVNDLPALAITPLTIADGGAAQGPSDLSVSSHHLENDKLRVEFDDAGRITSLLDKSTGREIVIAGARANRLQAFRDMPPQYDAWDIDPDFEDQVFEIDTLVAADVVETGPYRAAIRFEWTYESSRIVQIVALEAQSARLDVDCAIDWREHHTLLKSAFPLDVHTDTSTAEIQFGHVRRPTHRNTSWDQARFETLMHRWVDISEPEFGVALLNDCKYGYDARDTTLRLTLLRSPTDPWPDADQGLHRLRYGLLVHAGMFAGEGVPAAGEAFNMPLEVVEGSGAAKRTAGTSLVSVAEPGVTIEAVKKAHSGDDIIVRLWETRGRSGTATLSVPDGYERAAETDLLERDADPLTLTQGQVVLALKPFDIRTLRLARR